jgi:hypothetical protein
VSNADDPDINESQAAPASTGSTTRGKPSNKSLTILAVIFALAGISAFAVPRVLQEIYYQEEEAKRDKNPLIVGNAIDTPPPEGKSNPYAGMPSRQGGNAAQGENDSRAAKDDEPSSK